MPTDDLYARILAALIRARCNNGLTREEVAALLDRPKSFVADYESDAHRLDPAEYVAVARAIGGDPYQLLAEAESTS